MGNPWHENRTIKPRPTNLTPLENMVYDSYLASEYLNNPGDEVWTFSVVDRCVNQGMGRQQFPGVVSSLVQKGVFGVGNNAKKRNQNEEFMFLR